jgi:hypothetical protein
MLFSPGSLVATPAALKYLTEHGLPSIDLINRHVNGDWGDLSASDKQLNDQAVRDGSRIFSAYIVAGEKLYVITEWDRSYTTVLLASEY